MCCVCFVVNYAMSVYVRSYLLRLSILINLYCTCSSCALVQKCCWNLVEFSVSDAIERCMNKVEQLLFAISKDSFTS